MKNFKESIFKSITDKLSTETKENNNLSFKEVKNQKNKVGIVQIDFSIEYNKNKTQLIATFVKKLKQELSSFIVDKKVDDAIKLLRYRKDGGNLYVQINLDYFKEEDNTAKIIEKFDSELKKICVPAGNKQSIKSNTEKTFTPKKKHVGEENAENKENLSPNSPKQDHKPIETKTISEEYKKDEAYKRFIEIYNMLSANGEWAKNENAYDYTGGEVDENSKKKIIEIENKNGKVSEDIVVCRDCKFTYHPESKQITITWNKDPLKFYSMVFNRIFFAFEQSSFTKCKITNNLNPKEPAKMEFTLNPEIEGKVFNEKLSSILKLLKNGVNYIDPCTKYIAESSDEKLSQIGKGITSLPVEKIVAKSNYGVFNFIFGLFKTDKNSNVPKQLQY